MKKAGLLRNAADARGVSFANANCVMLVDNKIVYAGPIEAAPTSEGKLVLLHPEILRT